MGGFGRDPIPGMGAAPAGVASRHRVADPMRLRVCNGPGVGREFPIDGLRMRIGRNDPPAVAVDIDLSDCELGSPALISRLHAELIWADGRPQLIDLGSRNGTWVDEQPLTPSGESALSAPVLLRTGSRVRLANLEMEVVGTDTGELKI